MSHGRLPDCVGSSCRYVEFEVTEVAAQSYRHKHPITGEQQNAEISDDVKTAFKEAVESLYRSFGTGCGGWGCSCAKTEKVLSGPTVAEAPREHTHMFPGGAQVRGTYKLKTTVYEGVCVPAETKSGSATHDACCDWSWYYRGYCYPGYWRWNYWSYQPSWRRRRC